MWHKTYYEALFCFCVLAVILGKTPVDNYNSVKFVHGYNFIEFNYSTLNTIVKLESNYPSHINKRLQEKL